MDGLGLEESTRAQKGAEKASAGGGEAVLYLNPVRSFASRIGFDGTQMGTVHAHEGKSHHLVRGKADLAEGTRGSGCHAAKNLCSKKMSLHVGDGGAAAADGGSVL